MELELNKIYNEDCLEGMKKIPDNSIDLIVTDPPYLINYKTNWRKNK
ncbi:DNA methylase [Staphylococcus phage vB_SauM-HM01]|nr:DNA methylase [Staphylococcus phage vB_SauM-HM01]